VELSHLRDNLGRLGVALGSPVNFPRRLLEVKLRPASAFAEIAGLEKGNPVTSAMVRAALQGPPLFEFAEYLVHRFPENTLA
jgi:hypothetical protein